MDKERLTFWEILFEGIKKFAGEIIGAFLLAVFLLYFPGFRSMLTEYVLPKEDESQTEVQRKLEEQRQEQERLKEELRRKEEALKAAEEARKRAEAQRKLPSMSDSDFMYLCTLGTVRQVEAAIKNGANVNARSNNGRTALMLAARYGRAETAELLLKHGANVNDKDYDGNTALSLARRWNHKESANLLRSYGAQE